MICNNDFAVDIAESLLIFYLEHRSSADVQVSQKYTEGMRNISAGNNSKIFLMKSKKSDKRKNKNGQNNGTKTKTDNCDYF